MGKQVSGQKRKKLLAKLDKPVEVKKKRLKHPPKIKKEKIIVDEELNEQPLCCKKSLIPNKRIKENVLKGKMNVHKKIKIIPVKSIHVGQPAL